LAVAASALAAARATIVTGGTTPLDGLVEDATAALVWQMRGQKAESSPHVAVVGLDWGSLREPELAAAPRALYSPLWADLIGALARAGAQVIAFDLIFEWQGGSFIPNYDRPFLQALAGNRGRVILARTGGTPPARPFMMAAGGRPPAIALAEMEPDDGVVRRVAAGFAQDGGPPYPTLSGAALTMTGGPVPETATRPRVQAPLELSIPTYPMAEVLRLDRDEDGRAKLARAFGGRVVFVGTLLPEEDRKIAPDRFMLQTTAQPPQDAGLPTRLGISGPQTGSVPGVMLHAAAVDGIRAGTALRDLPFLSLVILAAACAAAAAAVVGWLRPVMAGVAIAAAALTVPVVVWALGGMGWHLPAGQPLLALCGAPIIAFAFRYMAEERRRRYLHNAFGHYVAPQVVAALEKADESPKLGGEMRQITCMFADLSGFTALSTKVDPPTLMAVTNHYLGLITEAVDRSGGYVDKFIGDAVMAMWNAPSTLDHHPRRAVEAALEAAEAVRVEAEKAAREGHNGFSVKIGLNTGDAVVGNLGAARRINYSAVGEAVNVASRLEPLPPLYNCAVVFSESTAQHLGEDFAVCELDLVRVKGRAAPVRIFTALQGTPEEHADFLAAWNHALATYRAADFTTAAALWRALPPPAGWPEATFGPADAMAQQADAMAAKGVPADWDGVRTVAKG
jgi:adenylate cyclase